MLHSEVILATLQESLIDTEQRLLPSPIPKSRACVHLPWRQSSETHLMQTLPLTGRYSGFFRASIFYSVKCSYRDHRTTSIYSVQGTEPWRKKKRLPSFHAREMHQGWESGAVTWLSGKEAAATEVGWGFAWVSLSYVSPFPLNVGSKALLLLFLEKKRLLLTIWCVLPHSDPNI